MQKLSQAQVASMTAGHPWRVSRPAISSIERGENLPSFEALMALSKVLLFDPMEVLERARLAKAAPVDLTGRSLGDLRERARELAFGGDFRSALTIYDAMLERLVLDPPGDRDERARWTAEIEVRRATALQRCGALLSAEAAAKRAVNFAGRFPPVQSQAYAVLAIIELQRGFVPLARDHARRAVELVRECEPALRVRALIANGNVLLASDEFSEARESFVEAREIIRAGADPSHASHVEGNIGLCWQGAGDLRRARVWLERARAVAREQARPILEARWTTELGRVALDERRLEDAERHALAALAIARPRDHAISVFRAEWLRHLIVKARDPGAADRRRCTVLRKLMSRLADHIGEREIQEYQSSVERPEREGRRKS